MSDSDEFFRFDLLYSNCDYIRKYCENNRSEMNNDLVIKCNQLLDFFRFIDVNAVKDLTFQQVPSNGFDLFLRVAISFTNRIVSNIRSKNRPDALFLKLFELMFAYRDWLLDTYETLKKEQSSSLMTKEFSTSSKACYNVVHSNEKTLRLAFSRYAGFWLSRELQKILYLFLFIISFAYRLPYSMASIWSEAAVGKYAVKAFKNANLAYVFNVWHLSENAFVAMFSTFIFNIGVPVKSKTLQIPKQTRFRLDSKGNILDFDHMTKEEIDAYLNDKNEQDRLDAPGKRHRNRETIRCRYSYISSRTKIKASLKRIEERKKMKSQKFKLLKHYSDRRTNPTTINESNNKDEISGVNANIEEFEIKIGEEDQFLDRSSNPENTLLIYIHGGGFFTQGSHSAEIFLRKICSELGGIPILAIDYSLTVPFPVPNQEILDVYLWALSGGVDVKETLGFNPKKIVVSGDSAGGFFSLSLTITINELNKLLKRNEKFDSNSSNSPPMHSDHHSSQKYTMPSSIVAAYAAMSLVNFTPSKMLFCLEPLVELHLYLLMISIYASNMWSIGDFKKIENTTLFQEIASKNRQQFEIDSQSSKNEINMEIDDSSPWYLCDYSTYKNYSDYLASFYNNPLISPACYADNFEDLKNVSLFAFVGDQDFLLDDSIELCRRWKGNVHIDVMKGCIHGFLQFGNCSRNMKEAVELVIERYQEACGLI